MHLSTAASTRIRRFSWVTALVVVAVVSALVATAVGPSVSRALHPEREHPWRGDPVVEATAEAGGTVWAAEGSARVALPEELRDRPLLVQLVGDDRDRVNLMLGDRREPTSWPHFLRIAYDAWAYPIAVYSFSELWVVSEGPWRLEFRPVEATRIVDTVSGTGDAILAVGEGVTSGTVRWSGEGSMILNASTVGGWTSLVNAGGAPDDPAGGEATVTWEDSPLVVFDLASGGDVRWTFEVDAPKGSSGAPTGDEEVLP